MTEQAVITWVSDDTKWAKFKIPRITGDTYEHGPHINCAGVAVDDQALVTSVGNEEGNWHVIARLPDV